MSQRVAEGRTLALRWEAEAQGASKRLVLQTRALDHALAALHESGVARPTMAFLSEASSHHFGVRQDIGGLGGGRADASKSSFTAGVSERESVRVLESRVEEVTTLWKAASKDVREANAQMERYKEEKSISGDFAQSCSGCQVSPRRIC